MRRFPPLLLALALMAGTACDDPAGSERGVYVLRTVGDSTVPYVSYDPGSFRDLVVADTMGLDGRGNLREVSAYRVETPGQPDVNSVYVRRSRYTMHGDTLTFVGTCPPGVDCIGPMVGYTLVSGGIATYSLQPSNPSIKTSFFERIR